MEALADAAYLTQPQISEIEGAKVNIRLDILQSLATGLSVRLADLFEENR
jgi:transcriptional regulator with XRE-family HTH domain